MLDRTKLKMSVQYKYPNNPKVKLGPIRSEFVYLLHNCWYMPSVFWIIWVTLK